MMNEEILQLLRDPSYQPQSKAELAKTLQIPSKKTEAFEKLLKELEQEGRVYKTKKKKYILPEKAGLLAGILSRTKKGFGFVIDENNPQGDVYISGSLMKGAMNGDLVLARILSDQVRPGGAGSREGEILKVLKRKSDTFAGIFEKGKKHSYVRDTGMGEDIRILGKKAGKARDGDKVLVKMTRWPEEGQMGEGKVTKVFGSAQEPDANLKALIWQHGLPESFPGKVLQEAEELSDGIEPSEIRRRKDLRQKTIVTIDGAQAKDLDDGVSVERLPNGKYLLGVHIADVSHYVRQDSRLDKEARKRGTSVYFINRVIPMLPEKLSNGLCSLNPGLPRLALTCEMEIDPKGQVKGHRIFESLIQTRERLVYTDVSDILEKKDKTLISRYRQIYPDLLRMQELAVILRKRRMEQGSMDFDMEEADITVDEKGVPIRVEAAERRSANSMIEEFMLKANQTVAEHFFWMEIPFLYRVHESPDPEKIEDLKGFIWNFGYRIKGKSEKIHPGALNEILTQAKGRPEEHLINMLVLRSMKKAAYETEEKGHFGLGFPYYSHFTSPIRRYPDLLIHRIIKLVLHHEWDKKTHRFYLALTREVAESASESERNAEKMERDVEKLKLAEYMSYRIGEIYEGIISGVVSSGFFVQIEHAIEGFVSVGGLHDDYYQYDKKGYRLIGERTGKRYELGQSLQVRVVSVSIADREINFALAGGREGKKRKTARGERGRRSPQKRMGEKKDRQKEENEEKGLRRKGGPGREAGPSKRQPEKEKTVYEKDVRRILEGGAKRSPSRKWIRKARGGVKGR